MRKILLGILTVLMLVIMALCMRNGIHIGKLQVPGFQDLQNSNVELTEKINKTSDSSKQYESALTKLKGDINSLTKAKKDYLDLVTVSTESEIQQATQTKTYTIEYLWSRIGNHATQEGVNIKMDVASSTLSGSDYKNLNFAVTGNYLAITNFISTIENDSNLDFIIDSFDMTNGKCTFTVKDVKIQTEKTTATVNSNTGNNTNTTSTNQKNENSVSNQTQNADSAKTNAVGNNITQ